MKLPVFKTVGTAFTFGVRHFSAFYLLCLLGDLPRILTRLLDGDHWILPFAATRVWTTDVLWAVEFVSNAFIIAVMVWTFSRDRQDGSRTVVAALRDVSERAPTILGVGITLAVTCTLLSILMDVLAQIHPRATIVLLSGLLYAWLAFAVVIPCAAVDDGDVMDCFIHSAKLTQGSRLRILLVYFLVCIPVFIAFAIIFMVVQPRPEQLQQFQQLPLGWLNLVMPVLSLFLLTTLVAIYQQLTELEDDVLSGEAAAVFD